MFAAIRSLRVCRAVIVQKADELVLEHGAEARHVAKMQVADAYFAKDVDETRRANQVLREIEKRLLSKFDHPKQRSR